MPTLKIPKERIGVLIGEDGKIKEMIEERANCELDIDSKTGEVDIDTSEVEDPLLDLKIEDVIKAVGRGFNPHKAMEILKEGVYFDLIDIRDYVGKSPNAVRRIKGRVIGKNGRTRELIEDLSESYVSVYGRTVGIIGGAMEVDIAKQAVQMLLEGAEHRTVYSFLESKRADLKMKKSGWF